MTRLLAIAYQIIEVETPLIEPARLAHLDQVAAVLRDEGADGYEILAGALEALDRCATFEDEMAAADVAYIGALLVACEARV